MGKINAFFFFFENGILFPFTWGYILPGHLKTRPEASLLRAVPKTKYN